MRNIFDADLRRTSVSLWNGVNTLCQAVCGYDSASRLASVSDGTVDSAAYWYLGNSPVAGQQFGYVFDSSVRRARKIAVFGCSP